MSFRVVFTKQAGKDAKKINGTLLGEKVKRLLSILELDPFEVPPPFEVLRGDLQGAYSRRINIQHRLVYQVIDSLQTVKVLRMWTHYE